MSVDYHVHVGPYARVKLTPRKVDQEIKTCSNTKCRRYKDEEEDEDSKFCPQCGSPVKKRVVKVDGDNADEDSYEVGRLGEFLSECSAESLEGYKIYVSNENWKTKDGVGVGSVFDPTNDFADLFYTPDELEAEITAFEQRYVKELDKIKLIFGAANVEVRWGVISTAG